MPAINLARLRRQISDLGNLFTQPFEFRRELHKLLDLYADRTHRPGQAGEPPPLLNTYNVPPPILHEIRRALQPIATAHSEAAIELAKALWSEPYTEFKQIAAFLLGTISPSSNYPVLEIVEAWLSVKLDEYTLADVLKYSLANLQRETPEMLLNIIAKWLASNDLYWKRIGLLALLGFPTSLISKHLPKFLKLMTPYTRVAPLELRPAILDVLRALAFCSPRETTYFLRQSLEAPENPDAALLIRQLLPALPDDLQENLRQLLKAPA